MISRLFTFRHLALLAPICLTPFFSGCASSPSGGPVIRANNRLQATLSVRGTLNNNYYYAVAFDDQTNDSQGPNAIIGNSPSSANNIVGGNFRLLVLYHLGQFRVFYREDPTDSTTEIPVNISGSSQPLFTETPRATNNGIIFTINLDATFIDGGIEKYYFPNRNGTTLNTTRLDLNFVTTSDLILASEINKIKPVDAFGDQDVSSPVFNFQINSTRTQVINDVVPDRPDPRPYDSSYNNVDFNQIDVTNLRISVTRGN
jgi:hypothetical protein